MKRWLLFFLFFILSFSLFAGNGFVFLSDTTKLFFVSDNEIYSPDKEQLLYFQKGNIFFNGSTDERSNIFLLSTSMNIASEKNEMLYEKDNREPYLSFSKNKFYAIANSQSGQSELTELLYVEKVKKWLAFYSSHNDSLLAYYNYDSLSPSVAVIVAYTLVKKFELDKKNSAPPPTSTQFSSYATIKPAWGNPMDNEWIWDGNLLRPRWNIDPRLAWTFDGETIKPYYGNNIYAQYSWDGETLKPIWRSSRGREWIYDGRLMKPAWDTDWANQYKIENGVVQPWSNVHSEREWRVDGNLPIPLIMFVISGMAKTY